jgi:hypothetical protein
MQRRLSAEASCVFHYLPGGCTRDRSGLKAPQGDARLQCEGETPSRQPARRRRYKCHKCRVLGVSAVNTRIALGTEFVKRLPFPEQEHS